MCAVLSGLRMFLWECHIHMAEPVWLVNRMRVTMVENAVPKGVLGGKGGTRRTLCPRGEARM